MKCPHCKKKFEAPDALYRNTECFGGGSFTVISRCCGNAVQVATTRRVHMEIIGKGNDDEAECWR